MGNTKLRTEWVAKLKARTAAELARREALRRQHGRALCWAREGAGSRMPCVSTAWVEIEGVPLCFAHAGAVTVYGRPLADVLDGVPRKRGGHE